MSSLIRLAIIWLALITECRCSPDTTPPRNNYCPPCGPKVDKDLVCSKPVKAQRMSLLEPHINSGLGVSFKAYNGMYVQWLEFFGFITTTDVKVKEAKFMIEKVGENTIYLKPYSYRSLYLTTLDKGWFNPQLKPDQSCLLTVHEDGGKIVLQDYTGKFLAAQDMEGENKGITRDGIDESTRFIVETGSITPVKEEILSVSFGKVKQMKYVKPLVIAERTISNESSRDVSKTVSMEWTYTKSQQTSWEHGWGVTSQFSYKASAGIEGIASESFEFSLELNYNGQKAGNEGTSETITLTESQHLTVAPGTKVTAELCVSKIDSAEIPFTAKIRRTSEVGTVEFEQRGTWKGVIVWKTWLNVNENKL